MSNGCHYDTGLAMSCVFSYKVQYLLWLTQSTAASNCGLEFPPEQLAPWLWRKSDWYKAIHPLLEREQNPWVIRHRRHVTGLSSFWLLVFASEDMHVAPDGIHALLQEHTAVLLFLPLLLPRLFAFAFVTPGLSCAGWRGSTLYLLCRENNMGNKPSTTAHTAWTRPVCSSSQTKSLSIMQTSRVQVGFLVYLLQDLHKSCVFLEN